METMAGNKRKIFEVALDMFAKDSYHTVTMRDIAQAVGIQPPSIYNHFKSKDELLTTIFEYFDGNMQRLLPKPQELLSLVEHLHPHVVLWRIITVYPEDIRESMSRAMLVTSSLMRSDPRADDLIFRNLVNASYATAIPLLERMLELDLIEPLNPEIFALILSSFCHSTAIRFYYDKVVNDVLWLAGIEAIIKTVKVKHPERFPPPQVKKDALKERLSSWKEEPAGKPDEGTGQ